MTVLVVSFLPFFSTVLVNVALSKPVRFLANFTLSFPSLATTPMLLSDNLVSSVTPPEIVTVSFNFFAIAVPLSPANFKPSSNVATACGFFPSGSVMTRRLIVVPSTPGFPSSPFSPRMERPFCPFVPFKPIEPSLPLITTALPSFPITSTLPSLPGLPASPGTAFSPNTGVSDKRYVIFWVCVAVSVNKSTDKPFPEDKNSTVGFALACKEIFPVTPPALTSNPAVNVFITSFLAAFTCPTVAASLSAVPSAIWVILLPPLSNPSFVKEIVLPGLESVPSPASIIVMPSFLISIFSEPSLF